jgi:hypothetical protein
VLGEVAVASLSYGIVDNGTHDRRLDIVDHDFSGHPCEVLESLTMASQPSVDLLIEDHHRVLMTAVRKGHHEHPGPLYLPRSRIDGPPGGAEIHLGLLTGGDLDAHKAFGATTLHLSHEAPKRRVAPGEPVVVPKTLVYRHHLHASVAKVPDRRLVRSRLERLTDDRRLRHPLGEEPVKILRGGHIAFQQALPTGQGMVLGHGLAGDPKVLGDRSLRLTGTKPAQELTYVEGHKPPSCHGISSLV